MKQKTGKYLLSFLLTLALVVGFMPGMSLTASAAVPYIDAYGESLTISSDQTCTEFEVCGGSTLTINQGVTLTLNDPYRFSFFDNSKIELHGTLAGSAGRRAEWFDDSYINVYLSDGAKYTVTGLSCEDGDNYLVYHGYDAATDGNGTVSVKNGSTDVTSTSKGYKTTTYTFTATPNSGYKFKNWTKGPGGEVLGTDASINVTCEQNGQYQVYANFEVDAVATHSVTVTAGSNMTKTTDSGAASQTDLSGAMTDVVYTANDGYYFPEDYSIAAVNGISVTRNSYTQITVSGTPTADAAITLTAPTAKTTPDAPTTAAATDCTTADNNDGKLTGVTTAMEYKKSDAENWTAGTGSDITGLVPGSYYVRAKATDTTNASDNQELTVKGFISYTVTFKVVNGKWNEGEGDAATADKTVTLTGHDGDTLKLTADQIPAVGSKPNDTYKAGSWDVTPSADTAITAATTYTYTYAQKASVSQTVTFKVVNGKWDDDSTADKTVTLTGYEGDTLKLAANQIPAVGTKPNDTYKAGSWDTTPSADTEITADTTYTYTYAQKEAATVTKAPEAKTLTYTGDAQELVTAGTATGGEMQYSLDGTTWSNAIPTGIDAGDYTVYYQVVGDANHNDSTPDEVSVCIGYDRASATAPTARNLTYTGETQELVTAGTAEGGELVYAIGTDAATAPTDGYTATVPTAADAGTYYVWYMVVGDENHIDTTPACITVTIGNAAVEEKEGLTLDEDGTIRYYTDSVFDPDYVGTAPYAGGLFLVKDGFIYEEANGLVECPTGSDNWYWTSHGKVHTEHTGLVQMQGTNAWFFVTNGKLDRTKEGRVAYDGSYFIVSAGQLHKEYTGLWQDPETGSWAYYDHGQFWPSFSGVTEYNGGLFLVSGGLIDSAYAGEMEYNGTVYTVVSGQLYNLG